MKRFYPQPGAVLAAALAIAFFPTPPASAAPQIAGKPPLHLSAQALRQIDALEREADTRTPAQQKIDSQLLYTLKMVQGRQIAPDVPVLRTGVNVSGTGLTLVDMDADVTPDVLNAIARAGGTVVYSSPRWKSIRANIPLSALETLAALPDVRSIKRPDFGYLQNPAPVFRPKKINLLTPFLLPQRVSLSQREANVRLHLSGLLAQVKTDLGPQPNSVGSVADEADKTHRADKARSTFHVDGTGIKIGVLSDSIDNGNGIYADAVNSGDVPPVTVISGQSGGNATGEGLAMLEGIHDLAPGAKLYFATGNSSGGTAQFADNIVKLQQAGCKVIVDDIGYSEDPAFQDGILSQAVNQVTAAGAMYFSSAANSGNLKDGTASCWEGDFLDSGDTFTYNGSTGKVHLFDGVSETDDVSCGNQIVSVTLMWSDPLGKSSNDYDLFTLDSTGSTVRSSSTTRQTGSQDPIESVKAGDGDVIVVVLHKGSTRYLRVVIDTPHSTFHYVTPGRTVGHNATPNTFCVAATPAADAQTYSDTGQTVPGSPTGPYPDPFNSSNNVEQFSDDGPRHMFYDPSGKAYTSSLTHTGGIVFGKPDFTAADGTSTSLTADEVGTDSKGNPNEAFAPFFGTSCAAPHAAAIAALVLSYNPSLTRAQLSSILDKSCTDIEDSGFDINSGYGILDAYKALQNTPAAASVTSLSFTPNPVTSGQNTTGTIKLSGPAPSGGAAVDIKVNGSDLGTTPVAAGSTSGTFTLSFTVSASTNETVTATYGGKTVSTTLTVNPAQSASPVITSLSPSSATAGGSAFTLTVNGTGFAASSLVKWNGATQTTTYVSSTKLTASIAVSLIASAGTADVTVTTPHVSTSAAKTFTINAAANASPVLSSVSPTTRTAGGGSFVLTANGTNFTSASIIKWNGASQTTTYVSSTKLTTTIPASLIASAGTASITVTTPHVGTSGAKTVTVSGTSSVYASKLSFNPASISSNGETVGTVTLSGAAPSGGAAVNISYQGTSIITATVAAGNTSTTFVLDFGVVSAKTVYQIDAIYGGKTASANVTVNTTSVQVSKLSFSPSTVTGSNTTTGTVTLTAAAPTGGAVVTITQDGTAIGSVTVAAGNSSYAFTYAPGPVSSQQTFTMGAEYNGKTVTANLTAKP